jgi:hypothetical protein
MFGGHCRCREHSFPRPLDRTPPLPLASLFPVILASVDHPVRMMTRRSKILPRKPGYPATRRRLATEKNRCNASRRALQLLSGRTGVRSFRCAEVARAEASTPSHRRGIGKEGLETWRSADRQTRFDSNWIAPTYSLGTVHPSSLWAIALNSSSPSIAFPSIEEAARPRRRCRVLSRCHCLESGSKVGSPSLTCRV